MIDKLDQRGDCKQDAPCIVRREAFQQALKVPASFRAGDELFSMSDSLRGRQARWSAFQHRVERKGLREYESLVPFPYPMKLWFGADKPTRLFFFTKPAFINIIGRRFLFPKNWLVIERHSIPTPESLTALHCLVEGFRLPLVFVGDLRPLDLTVFALLRMGSTDFSAKGAKPLPITYAGIDDRWLALSDTFRRRGTTLPESRMG